MENTPVVNIPASRSYHQPVGNRYVAGPKFQVKR